MTNELTDAKVLVEKLNLGIYFGKSSVSIRESVREEVVNLIIAVKHLDFKNSSTISDGVELELVGGEIVRIYWGKSKPTIFFGQVMEVDEAGNVTDFHSIYSPAVDAIVSSLVDKGIVDIKN